MAYPITTKFIEFQKSHVNQVMKIEDLNKKNAIEYTMQKMLEFLGEYEHGAIDEDTVLEMVGRHEDAAWVRSYYHEEVDATAEADAKMEKLRIESLEALRSIYEDLLLGMIYSSR